MCHGELHEGTSYLCLEDEDGRAAWVDGQLLVDQIGALAESQRPLLVVLSACQSAGVEKALQALAELTAQPLRDEGRDTYLVSRFLLRVLANSPAPFAGREQLRAAFAKTPPLAEGRLDR